MFTEFFELAYEKRKTAEVNKKLHEVLLQFPVEELKKMAEGDLSKLAMCSLGNESWIEQFKGTPLFEQAVALEQEEIQLQMQDNQKRQEEQATWGQRDALQLRKRLLALQAAQSSAQEEQAAQEQAVMEEQAMAEAPQLEEEKKPKAEPKPEGKTASPLDTVTMAGRILARSDFEKRALNMTGLGQGAMKFLGANRGAAIGAGVGALGGLAHGLQKDERGQRHLLRGAAEGVAGGVVGAGIGHAGGTLANNLAQRGPLREGQSRLGAAFKATGSQLKSQVGDAYGSIKGRFGAAARARGGDSIATPHIAPPSAPAAAAAAPAQLVAHETSPAARAGAANAAKGAVAPPSPRTGFVAPTMSDALPAQAPVAPNRLAVTPHLNAPNSDALKTINAGMNTTPEGYVLPPVNSAQSAAMRRATSSGARLPTPYGL